MDLGAQRADHRAPGRTRVVGLVLSAEIAVFAVAFLARVARVLVGGGFLEPNGYDPSVYYAAATGLVNGRVPYRDFTLVHPPGMALVEAPFAVLGRLTTDLTGYVAATLGIIVLASLNAVLVVRVAQAMGLARRAAVAGGLLYAVWTNAVAFEFSGRLEPVGNFFLLCGLLAFFRAGECSTRRAALLRAVSGVAFGAAVCTKLWWIVPVFAFLGWILLADRRWRAAAQVAVGGALALLVIDGPFFLVTRSRMWESIVLDQLSRSGGGGQHHVVFSYLVAGWWSESASTAGAWVIVAVGGAALAWGAVRAWRWHPARPVLALLAAQLLQLWFQPAWFPFYADFVTVGLVLVVAAAFAAPEPRPRTGRRHTWVPAAAVLAVAANTTAFLIDWAPGPDASPTPFPRASLTAAVADARCVMSDEPMGLILLDALTRSFRNDCENWVDEVGRRLRLTRVRADDPPLTTARLWSRLFARHLGSGDVLLFMRPPQALGLLPQSIRKLTDGEVVIQEGGYTVYRLR